MRRWFSSRRGKLYLVADIAGSLKRIVFPLAWGLAFPDLNDRVFGTWIVAGILYVVHDISLSSAVRRDRGEQQPTTTAVDGVTLSAEEAERVREIVAQARARQIESPPLQ